MHVTVVATTDRPRSALWAWWTDFTPEDHATGRFLHFGRITREFLDRSGDHVRLRDAFTLFGAETHIDRDVTLHPEEWIEETARGEQIVFSSRYMFEDLPGGGTRVTRMFEVDTSVGVGKLGPAIKAVARQAARYDLEAHLEDFERDVPAPAADDLGSRGGG